MLSSSSSFHHRTGNPVCRVNFSVLVVGTVSVATETVDARDDAVGAGGTLGQRTLHGGAVVADAEGVVANADECAIFGALGGVARRGVVATSIGRARRVAGRCRGLARRCCSGGCSDGRGGSGESGVGLLLLLVVVRLDLRGDLSRRAVCGSRGSRRRVGGSGGSRSGVCGSRGLLRGGVATRALRAVAAGDGSLRVVVAVRSAHGGDKLARLREEDVRLCSGDDAVDARQVGHEERREGTVAGATRDVDVDAVLVHLTVADSVEPGPRQDGVARLHTLGHGDVPRVHTITLVVGSASHGTVGRVVEVAHGVGRAATLDRVDDVPAGRVGGVGGVRQDGKLAATSSVHSSVGTVGQFKLEREGLASDQLLAAGGGESSTVAGEVATAGVERVFRRRALNGLRLRDEHVGVGHAQEGSGHDGGAAEGGDRVEVVHVCGVGRVRTGSESFWSVLRLLEARTC